MDLAGIFQALGGLGLFLFGMKIMSSGLQDLAGSGLQGILKRATSNRFLAVAVGIVATVALNSSTASTVMTVSFINSGLMNLSQAIGVIMGANVGTTFSGQLVAFRLDSYAPIFIFIGVLLYVFVKNKKIKNIGYVILGFGVLFFGIATMSEPFRALRDNEGFVAMLTAFENPILAILVGFAFTAVVQSSTAATGILISMMGADVPIPFATAAFIILGTNIGTSVTTLIASIPANRDSKRAALFHISYDIIGSIVFGALIFFVPAILGWFETTWASDPGRQTAMFHTLYNVAVMVLLLGFVPQLAKLMERIIPKKAHADETYEKKLLYIGKEITKTPSIAPTISPEMAVRNTRLELVRMNKIAKENIALAVESLFEKSEFKAQRVFEREEIVDYLNAEITAHLVTISRMKLSKKDAESIGKMFRACIDIERISDHAENIAEYTLLAIEDKLEFSPETIEEMKLISSVSLELLSESYKAYKTKNTSKNGVIRALEEKVDSLSRELAANHVKRLEKQLCDPRSGVIFVDMISDLERSGDHAFNIATSLEENVK